MSIRDSSLKELRALAQQRLGPRGAELKTRQELIDALEKLEAKDRKRAPRLMVPLAPPLPVPPPVEPIAAEPPPEPMIWTADAPLPQITAAPIAEPSSVTNHFFLEPEKPRLPAHYEDDRVLTFARDSQALYAAWDFSASRFEEGAATGQVSAGGVAVGSFEVTGPAGGAFVEQLPPGVPLTVEVRRAEGVIGQSAPIVLPAAPAPVPAEGIAASSEV